MYYLWTSDEKYVFVNILNNNDNLNLCKNYKFELNVSNVNQVLTKVYYALYLLNYNKLSTESCKY